MSEGAPLLRTAERLDTGNNIIWGTTFHIPPAPRDRILCACIIDPAHQPQLQQHAQIIWGTTFHIPPAPRDRILCACIIDPAHQPQLQQHAQPRLSPFVYLR